MRAFRLPVLLALAGALASCATTAPLSPAPCGTYGYVDRDADGWIQAGEWAAFRAGAFAAWDVDRDGRIAQQEFRDCWHGGGFYPSPAYEPSYWSRYWSVFDADGDGWLSADEYWSAAAWSRLDRNANGMLDPAEWRWW